jgi:multidrug resistance efflux pump
MAAIEVQKAKLKLTEDELSPLVLKAAMDGIVTIITRRSGEAVTAGQPIVSIATLNPVRIVAYLRPPIMSEPVAGMKVEVRTRGGRRQVGLAKIMEIGTQMESLPSTLSNPAKAGFPEQGVPVDISMPGNLNIRAGELVDVIVLANQN